MTPIRRLQGVTYWVIEDPDGIYEFINANVRREWEADAREEGRDPLDDPWLKALPKRRWRLETIDMDRIKLNPRIAERVDFKKGYSFLEELAGRKEEFRRALEVYDTVIWPVVVKGEDMRLVDGYCRYATLKEMGVSKVYAYVAYRQRRYTSQLNDRQASG